MTSSNENFIETAADGWLDTTPLDIGGAVTVGTATVAGGARICATVGPIAAVGDTIVIALWQLDTDNPLNGNLATRIAHETLAEKTSIDAAVRHARKLLDQHVDRVGLAVKPGRDDVHALLDRVSHAVRDAIDASKSAREIAEIYYTYERQRLALGFETLAPEGSVAHINNYMMAASVAFGSFSSIQNALGVSHQTIWTYVRGGIFSKRSELAAVMFARGAMCLAVADELARSSTIDSGALPYAENLRLGKFEAGGSPVST